MLAAFVEIRHNHGKPAGFSLELDSDHMLVISPDEGGMSRSVYLANVLGLDMGMFYKRRDYTKVIDGRNPIVALYFLIRA